MTYGDIIEIIRQVCLQHKQVKGVYTVDTTRLEGAENTTINYPCVFVENPDIELLSSGKTIFKLDLAVITNSVRGNHEAEEVALDVTSGIAQDIFHKIVELRDDLGYQIDSASLQPIETWTADNNFGWRLSFSLTEPAQLCRSLNYAAGYPFGFIHRLRFDTVGDTTMILNESSPGTPDAIEFTYTLDGGTPVVSTSLPSSITTDFKILSVLSRVTFGDNNFYASVTFDSSQEWVNYTSPVNIKPYQL